VRLVAEHLVVIIEGSIVGQPESDYVCIRAIAFADDGFEVFGSLGHRHEAFGKIRAVVHIHIIGAGFDVAVGNHTQCVREMVQWVVVDGGGGSGYYCARLWELLWVCFLINRRIVAGRKGCKRNGCSYKGCLFHQAQK